MFNLKRNVKDDKGEYKEESLLIGAAELQKRHDKYDMSDDFVTISVSKKRVVSNFTINTDEGPAEYSKILAPGGITFLKKTEQLHEDKYNPYNVSFSFHKSQEIWIQKKTDKVIGKTENGKPVYEMEKEKISPEELKNIYEEEKKKNRETENWQPVEDEINADEIPESQEEDEEPVIFNGKGR